MRVRQALLGWQGTVSLSRAELGGPHSDWAEFVGPGERALLEDALLALPRRQGAPLRAVIAQADAQFYAKTLPN